jgi:hypothetical protein
MAAKKVTKRSAKQRGPKSGPRKGSTGRGAPPAKKPAALSAKRGPKAAAPKRTRRATPPGVSAKATRFGELERRPARKAEPRPERPPAVLPIPQSTFFF